MKPYFGGEMRRVTDLVDGDRVFRAIGGAVCNGATTERVHGAPECLHNGQVAITTGSGRHVGPADGWAEVAQ